MKKRDGLNSKEEVLKKTVTTCPFQVATDKMILRLHLQRDEPALYQQYLPIYVQAHIQHTYSQVFFSVRARDGDYYWSLDEKARFDDFNVYPRVAHTRTPHCLRVYMYTLNTFRKHTHTHTHTYVYIYMCAHLRTFRAVYINHCVHSRGAWGGRRPFPGGYLPGNGEIVQRWTKRTRKKLLSHG